MTLRKLTRKWQPVQGGGGECHMGSTSYLFQVEREPQV